MHSPHHGQIFQRHLRWAVLADRDTRMGATETQVGLRDCSHANEIVSSAHESCERRGEGHIVPHAQSHRRGNHLLLGNEHLEVSLRICFGELDGEGRVADLAVERDYIRASGAEGLQSVAVCLARGFFVALLIRGQIQRLGLRRRCRSLCLRLMNLYRDRAFSAEFGDRLLDLLIVERFAVPVLFVLDERDTAALHRLRNDKGGLLARLERFGVRPVDLIQIMPVDRDDMAAECACTCGIRFGIPAQLGLAALAKTVHIQDRDQVVELVVARLVKPLPDRALCQFAVAA
jgi:hypothetical protein